ncbi:MAG: M15 family metallopeptidase [Oscillospiraceae bacterium]|nr:M15 family metallopeptidase [Oscillospiraceae bacterium]
MKLNVLFILSIFLTYSFQNNMDQTIDFEILLIPEDIKLLMLGKTIHENSIMKFDDLRYLKIKYFGYDDLDHIGEIIVYKDIAEEVINIFKELHENKFPIEKIRLPDYYDGSDELSMRDNNSSGFSDRPISETKRSYHQFGLAIDINPLYNPFVIFKKDHIEPANSREFLDRTKKLKGMIDDSSICVQIFKKYNWVWGGDWTYCKDYQHFEKQDVLDIQNF